MERKIKLDILSIKNFVAAMNQMDFQVDLISGKYTVDAKSLMGIFSLDFAKYLTVRPEEGITEKQTETFEKAIQPYLA